MSKTIAIVLNWRDAPSTIACIDSLMAIDCGLDIIVVDNDSGDGSLATLEQHCAAQAPGRGYAVIAPDAIATQPAGQRFVSVMPSGRNGGYAYGNNIGMAHALSVTDCRYLWILNNDTLVPAAQTLQALERKMDAHADIGLCGATVVYAEDTSRVQTLGGGVMDTRLCRGGQLGMGHRMGDPIDEAAVEAKLSYINGACTFLRREFVEQIGPMTEDYFLYYEEVDWAMRGRAAFRLGYCAEAVVYHHVGKAIGTSDSGTRSTLSTYYLYKSRLKFCRRFTPGATAQVFKEMLIDAARHLRYGRVKQATAILSSMSGLSFATAKRLALV